MTHPRKSFREQFDLRRFLFGVLVTALVAILLGGSLGFASAEDGAEETDPALMTEFGVEEPRVGDKFSYTISKIRRTADHDVVIEAERPYIDYEWLPDAIQRDGDGNQRRVNNLAYRIHPAEGEESPSPEPNSTFHLVGYDSYDPVTQRSVSMSSYSVFNRTRTEPHPSGLNAFDQHYADSQYTRETSFPNYGLEPNSASGYLVCGVFNALQGTRANLTLPVFLFDSCRIGDLGAGGSEYDFHAIATGEVGGHEAVLFQHSIEFRDPNQGYSFTGTETNAWMAEDIPYPLVLEIALGHKSPSWDESGRLPEDPDADTYLVVRLAGYTRGNGPLAKTNDVDPRPAPPIEWKPRQPWGPDETGINHPFPLSSAFVRARDDPEYDGLRSFLREHPSAIVSNTYYDEWGDDDSSAHRWVLDIGDASAGLRISVLRRERNDLQSLNELVPGSPVPGDAGETTISYNVTEQEFGGHLFDPLNAPQNMPTVASVMARWRAYAAPEFAGEAPNMWEFTLHDVRYAGDADALTMRAGFLHEFNQFDWVNPSTMSTRWVSNRTESYVRIDASGWTSHSGEHGFRSAWGDSDPPQQVPPTKSGGGPKIGVRANAVRVVPWALPTGKAAVATGFVALLAGAAYVFWPAVKSGLVLPLYSRVERPRVLDNARRSQIAAIIEQQPGIHFQEIARRLQLGAGEARHHLNKLLLTGVVTEQANDGFTCYFLKGALDRRIMLAAPVLKAEGARRVLRAVLENPHASLTDVAALTGLSTPTVHYHVRRLAGTSLVEARRTGGEVRLLANPAGQEALRLYDAPRPKATLVERSAAASLTSGVAS